MASEIVLPQWGMEMQDGVIVRWLKEVGDTVQEGEPLVEVETAKLQTELESTASGVLARIVAQEGDIVPIRGVLAIIAAPGEEIPPPEAAPQSAAAPAQSAAAPPPSLQQSAPSASGSGGRVPVVPAARRLAQEKGIDIDQVQGSGPGGRVMIADVEQAVAKAAPAAASANTGAKVQVVPAARRLATENGVDLARVSGSGPGGRVMLVDVETALQSNGQAPPDQSTLAPIRLEGMRRTIATRMLQSVQTMAQVTVTTEVNVTEAMVLRAGLSRHQEQGNLSPLQLVIKATARALKDHPRLNALQMEDEVRPIGQINIGVAVALEEGLITPVIRDADTKTLAELATEGRELAAKTREGRARPEDVSDGTFTISNLGANQIDAFTPIINPPQVAILGVGRVVEKPIIEHGEITKGSMMYLSLTFDHRIVDGAPAAAFLQTVSGYLQDPWWMVS